MKNSVTAHVIAPSPINWKIFGNQIYKIERDVFAEKAFTEEMMKSDINDPEIILVVLKDINSIVGFTYAFPESQGVARIVDTVLAKEYQNKGLISLLMLRLEEELKKIGYEYITQDAMVENGYADKIMKNYGSRIIESKEFVGEYGKQRYFKIQL